VGRNLHKQAEGLDSVTSALTLPGRKLLRGTGHVANRLGLEGVGGRLLGAGDNPFFSGGASTAMLGGGGYLAISKILEMLHKNRDKPKPQPEHAKVAFEMGFRIGLQQLVK
jgi:hypothetical protein